MSRRTGNGYGPVNALTGLVTRESLYAGCIARTTLCELDNWTTSTDPSCATKSRGAPCYSLIHPFGAANSYFISTLSRMDYETDFM